MAPDANYQIAQETDAQDGVTAEGCVKRLLQCSTRSQIDLNEHYGPVRSEWSRLDSASQRHVDKTNHGDGDQGIRPDSCDQFHMAPFEVRTTRRGWVGATSCRLGVISWCSGRLIASDANRQFHFPATALIKKVVVWRCMMAPQ